MATNKLLVIGCGGTGTKICNEMIKTLGTNIPTDRLSVVIIDAHEGGYEPGSLDAGRANLITMRSYMPISEGLQRCVNTLEQRKPGCVHGWFPKDMRFPQEGMYRDGCGAYRPYGKFFAYYYYDNIRQTIERGLNRLTSSDFLSNNQRAQSSSIDVMICASLGNGTGGGIFMDVAAIVNDIITSTTETEPRVYGFFVPSSVTYRGPKNMSGHNDLQPFQIAAAGYAALVELQSEFMRRDGNADTNLRPTGPFESHFRSTRADNYDHVIRFSDNNKSPYDGVYLFDRRDDNGVSHSYPTIVKTAGQTLAAVIGGEADPEGRLLDVVLRFQEQCFSSMGVTRLCVPTEKLTDALVCKMSTQLISEVCERSSVDLEKWGHLLDLTIGEVQYPPPDPETVPDLNDYVQAFVKKFLRIQEAATDGNGTKSNQLFDLFAAEEQEVWNVIRSVGLADAEGGEIASKVNALYGKVGTLLSNLPQKCESKLRTIKWDALPRETDLSLLDSIDSAGVKFFIDSIVQRLVNSNAYGMLEAWLDALWLEVKRNKDSIEGYELKNSPFAGTSIAEIDITKNKEQAIMQELKTKVMEKSSNTLNRLIGGFMGDSVEDVAFDFESAAKKSLQFALWGVKLKAVSEFYDLVLSHVDKWKKTVTKLNNFLMGQKVRGRLQESYERASQELSMSSSGGGITEYLSCTAAAQDHLAKELLKNESLQSHKIFAGGELSSTIWRVLYSKVEASDQKDLRAVFSPNVGGDSELAYVNRNRKDVMKGLYGELVSVFRKKLRPHVLPLCKVDNLLREDSEALVIDYFDNVVEENSSISQTKRKEIENALRTVVPPTTMDELKEILTRPDYEMNREEKINQATKTAFRNRIVQLANAAISKIDTKVSKRGHINGAVSVIYNSKCKTINEIQSDLQDSISQLNNNMTGSLNPYDDFSSGEILAIGSIHGMTLNDLNMEDIHVRYRNAMRNEQERDSRASDNFAPHPTQQYMALGERYLKRGDSSTSENFQAELVLALANMKPKRKELLGSFGWLTFDKTNFKVIREMPSKHVDGTPLPDCMKVMNEPENDRKKYLQPTGFDDVIYWMEGSSRDIPNGPAWLKGFKKLLWDEIRILTFGDPNDYLSETTDIQILLDEISDQITELGMLRKYKKIRTGVEGMITGLKLFKQSLEQQPLDENIVPSLLR